MKSQAFVRYTFHPAVRGGEDDLAVRDLLTALQPAGWQEDDDDRTVRFWLPSGARAPEQEARLTRLAMLGALSSEAQESGWLYGWRRFHHPVTEGVVRIRPPWYPAKSGCLDVVVDTGMAFGTGSHFTTRLCLRALQDVPLGSLVDAGTGSGVLALAALRLGFDPVWAIDNDPVAVESCARNAAVNGLEPHVFLGDVTDARTALPAADVMVANLLRGPLLELARRLRAADAGAWAPTRLLLSGLLEEQGDEVLDALEGYALVRRAVSSGWLLLDCARRV